MNISSPVVQATVKPFQVPLNTSFAISQGALEQAENVLVILEDDQGRKGFGEAAPFPVLTGDTQESARKAAGYLACEVQGKTPSRGLHDLLTRLWEPFAHTPTARTAVEMALWDLRARQLGVSLSSLWGHAELEVAHTDITLPIMDVSGLKAFWERFQAHKFPYLKIKVGVESVDTDVGRIVELSRIVPTGTRMSLDGNQGCSVVSALEMITKLARAGVTPLFFEQPLPQDDWQGMSELTRRCPVPVCADETVKTAADAVRVVQEKSAHMINLKFMKSGIQETLRIVNIAQAAGLSLMIGGMVESEVGMTASLHAFCGTGQISWCDLDTPFFFTERITVSSPYHANSSLLRLPQGSGLGIDVDLTKIGSARD